MDTFNILVIYDKYIICQYNFKMNLLIYTCTVTQNASAIFNPPPHYTINKMWQFKISDLPKQYIFSIFVFSLQIIRF